MLIDLKCGSDGDWTAEVKLAKWAGYQSRLGICGSKDREGDSDGTVRVGLVWDGRPDGPVTEDELANLRWFETNHAEQAGALQAALWEALPRLRSDFLDAWMLPEDDQTFPIIQSPTQLRKLIGLHDVHVHGLTKYGIPYVGYEFGCDWDDEHGLGVLMHGNRAVEIGHADCSFTLWVARRDAQQAS
jgi:hypothetical protein